MAISDNQDMETVLTDKNAPGTHEKVISILMDFLPGRLLDAPSGEGALLQRINHYHKVVGADIDENYFKLKSVPFYKVNLNEPLPFEDSSFDYIVCIEGIEHLENPYLCIREFTRILKSGGRLVLSTPNIMSIKSRTRFFFYSYHDFFRFISLSDEYRHGLPGYEHEHINPMTYQELRYALNKAGMSIVDIHTNRFVKPKKLSFFYPLVKSFIISKTRSKAPNDHDLFSNVILEGEILILHAQKNI